MSPSTVTILAAFAFGFAEGAVHHGARISPELEPESDKKFFGKNGDYPTDHRPVADRHYVFDHPYPAVQDSSDYDKDYVKDENKDNGEWKAHMEYDQLRSQIREAEEKLEKLKAKMEEEEQEWKDAKDKYKTTAAEAEAAEKDRKKSEQEAKAAGEKVDELGGTDAKAGGAVGDSVKKVEEEMTDLEKCKEELAKAKKRLEELMKEKEALDAKNKETEEAQKKDKESREQEAKNKQGERETAEKDVEKKAFDEAAWKKKVQEETVEHEQAVKSYEEEVADVKRTEEELKVAAANLRKFRRPPYVDDNGGVYNVPKGSARPSTMAAALLVSVVAALWA